MLLGQGRRLACGEPKTAAKRPRSWPGDGLGESQWTEICGRVGHGSSRNGVARRSRSGAGTNVALTTHERLTGLLCRRRHEHGLPADDHRSDRQLGTLQRNEQSRCASNAPRDRPAMSAPAPRGGRPGAARPTPAGTGSSCACKARAYTLARNSFRKSSYAREGHHVLSQLFDWQRFIYHSFYCSNGSW